MSGPHQPPDQRHDGGRKPTKPPPKPVDAYSSVATMSSALLAAHIQIRDLERELRISYPMTAVDCLISELREIFMEPMRSERMAWEVFEERVGQFKQELERESIGSRAGFPSEGGRHD